MHVTCSLCDVYAGLLCFLPNFPTVNFHTFNSYFSYTLFGLIDVILKERKSIWIITTSLTVIINNWFYGLFQTAKLTNTYSDLVSGCVFICLVTTLKYSNNFKYICAVVSYTTGGYISMYIMCIVFTLGTWYYFQHIFQWRNRWCEL